MIVDRSLFVFQLKSFIHAIGPIHRQVFHPAGFMINSLVKVAFVYFLLLGMGVASFTV